MKFVHRSHKKKTIKQTIMFVGVFLFSLALVSRGALQFIDPSAISDIHYLQQLVITDDQDTDTPGSSAIILNDDGAGGIWMVPGALTDASVVKEDLNFQIQDPMINDVCGDGVMIGVNGQDVICKKVTSQDVGTTVDQYLQERVTGNCPENGDVGGDYINYIGDEGTVGCMVPYTCDPNKTIGWTAGDPLSLSPYQVTCAINECGDISDVCTVGLLDLEQYSCPDGEVIKGFASDNSPICVPLVQDRCEGYKVVNNINADGTVSCMDYPLDGNCVVHTPAYTQSASNDTNGCLAGTYNDIADLASTTDPKFLWECQGSNGGNITICEQDQQVDAACQTHSAALSQSATNSSNGCTAGTFVENTDTTTQWKWTCEGLNGGNDASCTQNKQRANQTCSTKPANTMRNTVSAITQTWNGTAWTPSTNSSYNASASTSSCRYTCAAGYIEVGGECKAYSRDIGTWGSCSANPSWTTSTRSTCSATCGGGTQTRTVSCSNTSGNRSRTVVCKDETGTTVNDSFCQTYASPTTKPAISDACTEACTGTQPATSQTCNTQGCPVNGACSTTAGICTAGTATNDNNSNSCGTTRNWDCAGINGGTTASCSKTNAACAVNGVCSTTAGACTAGTASSDNNATACGTTRNWTCLGVNGGTDASCSETNPVCAVNGVCSTTAGACTAGTVSNDNNATACGTTRTWDCLGSNGGSDDNCSETNPACAVNGACSTTAGACTAGTASNDNNSSACGTTRTWRCIGSNGGSTDYCGIPNAACPDDGVCGFYGGTCSVGTVQNDNGASSCGATRTWDCVSTNGGATASCSTSAAGECTGTFTEFRGCIHADVCCQRSDGTYYANNPMVRAGTCAQGETEVDNSFCSSELGVNFGSACSSPNPFSCSPSQICFPNIGLNVSCENPSRFFTQSLCEAQSGCSWDCGGGSSGGGTPVCGDIPTYPTSAEAANLGSRCTDGYHTNGNGSYVCWDPPQIPYYDAGGTITRLDNTNPFYLESIHATRDCELDGNTVSCSDVYVQPGCTPSVPTESYFIPGGSCFGGGVSCVDSSNPYSNY